MLRTMRGLGAEGDFIGSGETDFESVGLPGGSLDTSSGEADPSVMFADPGFNISTAPLADPRAQSFSKMVAGIVAKDAASWAAAITGAPAAAARPTAPAASVTAWAAQNKGLIFAAAAVLFALALAGSAGGRRR